MPLKKCDCKKCPSHEKELARLNRAIGQLEGVKKMISGQRYCMEILTLLKGVRSALRAVESNILNRHLEYCVADSFASARERDKKIAEIREMLDRFQS
ncbi:MAG: metal-sensitive transcriptional regulator [Rickettsiales bacterium]|jgi:DNA-binding FrmR family transcriptional regulator|nr:metal-sensitive transcriptional regulator [Rickettsiales bacterium]